ncbi:MAG: sigma-70 family RNA polymerase sigma factor [Cellulomonas sp.]|nr:sigma-70 family RNA polymerase sigma factor [Cellulomonas sp.]
MAIEGLQRSDAELLAAVRTGDGEAFGALYDRHAVAALAVARRYTNSDADAEDVVADAFTAVYNALRRGKGPAEAFRAYLFTVVRRVATVHRKHGRRVQATDDVATLEAGAVPLAGADAPALAGFESTVVARAFATLPERWQLVLWHTEVEGLAPAQVAPLLGLSANSASALAYRAREGLRQAYLTEHLAGGLDDRCRPVADKLGAYVRDGLGPRESRKVAAHLDECPRCAALYAELGDVNHGMRAIVAPLVLGIAGLGALDHLLPVGGGLAALGGLPGLTDGGAGAVASGAAGPGGVVGGVSAPVSTVGVVAAAAVALVVVVAVAVFALGGGGKPASTADGASAGTGAPSSSPVSASDTAAAQDPTSDESLDPVDGDAASAVSPPGRPSQGRARPVFELDASGSLLALRAGDLDQELRLAVYNSGSDVTRLAATLTLPSGVSLVGAPGVDGGGRSAVAASWGCVSTSAQAASCTLARLGAGATSVLTLRVSIAEDYDGTGGDLAVRFSGGRFDLAPLTVPVTVASAPARVVVTARGPLTLVTGRTRTLALDVTNAGGSPGQANVVVDLPYGTALAGPPPEGWSCAPRGLTEIGCTTSLDRRTSRPLELPLATRADLTPKAGLVTVTHTPGGGVVPYTVPYTMVRPATLVVTPAAVGPLMQGVVTDLPLTVTNSGGLGSAPVTVDVTLPPGFTLGGAVSGDGWTCTGTRCTHDGLAPGESAGLTVPLSGTSGASGDIVVTPGAAEADARPVQVSVRTMAAVTPPRASFTGNVRVVQVGAPLLSCTTDPACSRHVATATNNNGLPMTPLDTDPPSSSRPAVKPVSSSTTLTYPSGQDVLWAGLYWSANAGPADTWSTDRTVVQLRGPGGAYQRVSGAVVADVADNTGRQYYQSFADVTAQVRAAGGGAWSLADAAVAATATDPDPTYYAGWALIVVYGNPDAAGSRTVTVYDAGQWIAADQPVLTAAPGTGRQVTIGAVAWEGDAATSGDRLLLDGTALTSGSSDNAFDSTATGWGHANSLGVDAKAFGQVTARSDVVTLTASTTSDQFLLGAITITVQR